MKFTSKHTVASEVAVGAVAVWHAALAIAGITACIRGWAGEYVIWSLRHLGWALALAWIVAILRENRRLRSTPPWRAADDAWQSGYQAGARGAR